MISVIIPAYNEEDSIGAVVKSTSIVLKDLPHEIIVVDDGSTDHTSEMASRFGASRIIQSPYNKGMGASIKTGVRASTGSILVLIDGDGQHNPLDIPTLLSYLGEYDVVVGARSKLTRRIGNKILNTLASYLLGREIPDLTSGFMVMKKETFLKYASLLPNGFSCNSTIKLLALQDGLSVNFVTVSSNRRKGGKSKIHPVQDFLRFSLQILRMVVQYEPLKVFIPTSLALLVPGLVYLIYVLMLSSKVATSSVLLILSGVTVFCFGLIADQISLVRRSLR